MALRWRIDPRSLADLRLLVGLTLPAAAGLAVYGWRVVGVWALVLLGAGLSRTVRSLLHTWQENPHRSRTWVDVMLVTLLLPATLFDLDLTNIHASAQWPILVGAGVMLSILQWFGLRQRVLRVHPVVLTLAVLILTAPQAFRSERVLTRATLLGDVLDDRTEARPASAAEPWLSTQSQNKARVFTITSADARLQDYLHGRSAPDRPMQTLTRLVSDELPPLEDLVIGGHPRPIGCASAIAIVSGALFLIYRGYISWRVPALMLLSIYAGLLLAPVPTFIGDASIHRTILLHDPRIGAAMAITFANYLLTASPLLFVGLYLATHRDHRPRSTMWLCIYAVFFGLLAGFATAVISVPFGALLALGIAQFTGGLFHRLRSRLR